MSLARHERVVRPLDSQPDYCGRYADLHALIKETSYTLSILLAQSGRTLAPRDFPTGKFRVFDRRTSGSGQGAQTLDGRVPTPAAQTTDSATPSRPRAFSTLDSASAMVQNGARPSQVAVRQNVWHMCPASRITVR